MNRNMRFHSGNTSLVSEGNNIKHSNLRSTSQQFKKKPPPRPPPPNFNKIKSKSAWNLHNQFDSLSLIDLSPPESPKPFVTSKSRTFGGSVSSSFSSSTSSLASSKRSFECESTSFDHWTVINPISNTNTAAAQSTFYVQDRQSNVPAPTIIRPNKRNQVKTKVELLRDISPPMPKVPPPNPPKEVEEITTPYGVALYDYRGAHQDDLTFKANDVIFLIRRINSEWLYGRIEDQEGMFPSNHISVQVPLAEDDRLVTALYEFHPQAIGDLQLQPGQLVLIIGRVSTDRLIGESGGCIGQFPINFVDRVPSII